MLYEQEYSQLKYSSLFNNEFLIKIREHKQEVKVDEEREEEIGKVRAIASSIKSTLEVDTKCKNNRGISLRAVLVEREKFEGLVIKKIEERRLFRR